MDGWNEQLPWAETYLPGALHPPRNPASVGLSEPAGICRTESYLVFRFGEEAVSLTSLGIGYNQHKGKEAREGQDGPHHSRAAGGRGGEEGAPGRGSSQSSLRTSEHYPSQTLTTVTPSPVVPKGAKALLPRQL